MKEYGRIEHKNRLKIAAITIVLGSTALFLVFNDYSPFNTPDKNSSINRPETKPATYPEHKNITATIFWVGEAGSADNKGIHNRSSAWTEDWQGSYGGVDDPKNRCGFVPCSFIPKENPFYTALPYNDLDDNGHIKPSAAKIPWYNEKSSTESQSIIKNRWVKIIYRDKVAYAQVEDVGPFGEEDFNYVFGDGNEKPDAPEAGIDLSPATADFLGIDGRDSVAWQFVEESEVPDGPWKVTVTLK